MVLTADNRSYGNRAFPQKRGSLTADGPCYAKANLKSEREIAGLDDWTVDTVVQRRQALTSWALARWKVDPPPETSYDSPDRIAEVESSDGFEEVGPLDAPDSDDLDE